MIVSTDTGTLHGIRGLEDDMGIKEVTEKLQKLRRRTDVTGESFRDLFLPSDDIKNSLLEVAKTVDYDNVYDI